MCVHIYQAMVIWFVFQLKDLHAWKSLNTYLFVMAALVLWCSMQAFASCGEWGQLSSCAAQAPGHVGFSSCGTWGPNCPDQGSNPMSPALAGRLLTAEPLGKSHTCFLTELNFCPQLLGRRVCLVLFIL